MPPPADDRPVVDVTAMSPEELRAGVAKLTDERRAHVDELRERVGDTVEALAARLDVGARRAGRRLVTGVGAAVAAATVLLLVLSPPPPRHSRTRVAAAGACGRERRRTA